MAKQKLDDRLKAEAIMDGIFNHRRTNLTRQMLERIWIRNVLYESGEQWLQWLVEKNTFTKRYADKYVPTPVTNKIRDAVRSEKALILNKNYIPRIYPNSNAPLDVEASYIGELLLRDMDLRNDEEFREQKELVIHWMLLTGTAFMRTFPDMDLGEYAIDEDGSIIKSGEVVSEAVSPFSIVLDPLGDTLRKKRYAGICSIKNKEWVEDTFGILVNATESEDMDLPYTSMLMKFVGNASPWKSAGLVGGMYDDDPSQRVIFKEMEFKPTKTFPKGRYIVMADGQLILDVPKLPIPFKENTSDWMYSLTDFHWYHIPGRYWSDSFVNDLISPQDNLNRIDQSLVMNRRSIGRPRVILPVGATFKRLNEHGESYIAIEVDPRTSAGFVPKFENGLALPDQVLRERDNLQAAIQESAGDPKNILKGQNPSDRASGALVDILQEAAESQHAPDIQRFHRALTRVYRKRLVLAEQLYTEKRTIKVVGPDKEYAIKQFKGADLRNNTDVRLELSSGVFKTKASEAQSLMMLMQTGQFMNDPITKNALLRKLGMADLVGDANNVHVRRAQKENMKVAAGEVEGIFVTEANQETGGMDYSMEASVANPDPLFKFDNHTLHYESHTRFMLSDEFKTVPMGAAVVLMTHTEIHKMIMDAEQQKQMAQMMMMQQAGGKPGEGGPPMEEQGPSPDMNAPGGGPMGSAPLNAGPEEMI